MITKPSLGPPGGTTRYVQPVSCTRVPSSNVNAPIDRDDSLEDAGGGDVTRGYFFRPRTLGRRERVLPGFFTAVGGRSRTKRNFLPSDSSEREMAR